MTSYLDQFEKFPFGPLGMHMAKVKDCVASVEPMFEAVQRGDYAELAKLADRVFKNEHAADMIKKEIREAIPIAFSLPVYRGDLLNYLKVQDDMADSVEDIAVVLTIKNLRVPPTLAEDLRNYVKTVLLVCEELFQCTDQLTDLKERDFRGPKARGLLEHAAKAEHAEWEADKAQYNLAKKLFALDDEIKATELILWSDACQLLGKLANHADKTAERLRLMLNR